MATGDLQELKEHVSAHPEDHANRWRLAKRLYMSWEYGEALGHLRLLKTAWPERVNICRYLAATHYRLGQYGLAANELKQGIESWPEEIVLREQLARVEEIAGHREKAAAVWEDVLALQCGHPIAAKAIERLRTTDQTTPEEELHLAESDSGIHLGEGRTCATCGAQNGPEFDRCWQCHALLPPTEPGHGTPRPTPRPRERSRDAGPWVWTLVLGLSTVICLSVGMYLALRHIQPFQAEAGANVPSPTPYAILADAFLLSRAAITIALCALWPAGLWTAAVVCRLRKPPTATLLAGGMCLATLVNVMSWLPLELLPYAPFVLVGASAIVVTGLFRGRFVRKTIAWIIQACVACAVMVLGLLVCEGPSPLLDFPAIAQLAAADPENIQSLNRRPLTAVYPLRWKSTGSQWLDTYAGRVTLEVVGDPDHPPFALELRQGQSVVVNKLVVHVPFRVAARIEPGQDYEFVVSGPPNTSASLSVEGVLPLED